MTALSRKFDEFSLAMLGELTPTGKAWARVGAVVLVVAAIMSFNFGFQVSFWHGVFLAALSFAAAFGPEVAHKMVEEGRALVGCVIGVCAAGLLVIEFGSHNSYTAGIRGDNLAVTRVQNVRYDGAQDGVTESKTSLKLFEGRLADLESANPWSASVTADALRARLASSNLAIEQESARGGCKAKCLDRTKERDEIASRIAIAEEKSSLTKQIEATKKVIAGARATAATTEHKSSAVAHSNAALAKAIAFITTGSLTPSQHIETGAEISANLAMAIAGTGLPAFCLFVAGLYRRQEDDAPDSPAQGKPLYGASLPPPLPTQPGASPFDTLEMFHKAYQMRLAA